ncbi:MAG TPA: efflux RND transporter periplasmic adaptor subunit [Bacteroidota bacterium]|nr:efflux RND transporter periplasmic adaptor subunit [Bacteroidota bacterium]
MIAEKPDIGSLRIARTEGEAPPRTRVPWKYIITALLLLAAVLGFVALRGALAGAVSVETATATLTSPSLANSVLTANGYVVAQRKAAVASKGTGRLVYLGVEEGSRVRKGEVIGRLEDQDMVAALAKARADMQVVRADSINMANTLHREQSLFAAHLASQADLDAAEAAFLRVSAGIVSARAAVAQAEVSLEYTRIRAPFDGTVLTKDADVGEVVAPFASSANSRGAVVTMADMTSLQVEADVSESNITRVSVGQPCAIILDAYPDTRYQGVVHMIVPTADRAKATVLTKVAFRALDARVLPDMSAKVLFLGSAMTDSAASAPSRITVPSTAVTERDGHTVVFTVRDGVAAAARVDTAGRLGVLTVIARGLDAGTTVVDRPPASLETGTHVTVK